MIVYRKVFTFPPALFAKDGKGGGVAISRAYEALSGIALPDKPADVDDAKWERIEEWSGTIIGTKEPFTRPEAIKDWGFFRPIDALYAAFSGMTPSDVMDELKKKNAGVRKELASLVSLNTEKKLAAFHENNASEFEGLTALRSAIITLQEQLEEEKDKLLVSAAEKLGVQCAWYGDEVISIHSAQYKPSRRKDGAARPVYLAKYPTPISFVYGDLSEDKITGSVTKDKHDSVSCELVLGDDTVKAMGSRVSRSPASNAVRNAVRKMYEAKGRPFTEFNRNIPKTILLWEHVEVATPSTAEEEEGEGGSNTAAH